MIIVFLSVVLAGIIQGFSGIGFSLVTVPIFAQVFDSPSEILILTITLANIIMTLAMLDELRKKNMPQLRLLIPWFLATVITIPVGIFLVKWFNVNYLKTFVGIIVAISAVFLYKGYTWESKNERLLTIGTGLFNGFIYSTTGVIGPLAAVYALNQKWSKETYRINLNTYFWTLQIVTLGNYFFVFDYQLPSAKIYAYLIPAAVIGFLVGAKLVTKTDKDKFVNIIIALIFILGVVSLVTGVMSFI